MKVFLLLAVVCVAFCADQGGDGKAITETDGDEVKTFKSSSSHNFGCNVDTVTVVSDKKAENVGDALQPEQIESHIGDVTSLEWAHINQHFFSDVDGRSEEKIMGTPGGDLGEFILAMGAYEDETKTQIDQATATGLLMDYLKTMSRIKFYMDTSEHAHDNLTASSGCRNLDISDPPDEKKPMLLETITDPSNVGSAHLKYMLQDPTGYTARLELVQIGIRAFHEVMWNKTFPLSQKLCYIMLKGPHKEKAFVNVQTGQHCQDQNLAPLISPQTCYNSMYVNHPEAVAKFRMELAHFFAQDNAGLATAMIDRMNSVGLTQLAKTISKTLKGYPVYTIYISKSK